MGATRFRSRRGLLRALAAGLLATTPGCAALLGSTEPAPYVPANLSPAPPPELLSARAPVLARPRRLAIDLPSAIALAGGRSPEIELARVRLEEAENVTLGEGFALVPSVVPLFRAFSHKGQAQPQTGINVYVTRTNFLTQPVIAASWRPGPVIFGLLAASRREDAARAGTETARLESLVAAARGYLELVRGYGLVAVARDAVRAAEELERHETSLEKKGAGIALHVFRATAELAARRQDLALANGRATTASARLGALLQLEPEVELVPVDTSPPVLPLVPGSLDVTALIRHALEARPELRERRAELEARDDVRRGALYGNLLPFVVPLIQTGAFGPTLGKLDFSQDAMVVVGWTIGPGGLLDVPRIRAASLDVRRQRLELDVLAARIQREVSEAKARAVAAEESLEAAHQGVTAATEYLRLASDRFEKGVAIQLELLDAQRALARARGREVEAIVDFDVAQYDLLRAIGTTP